MTKEQIQDFSRKISQSSRSELVVVTYNIMLTYLETAEKVYEREDKESFLFNMRKARQFLNELINNLNFEYKISYDLYKLYLFINNSLFQSIIKKKPINFECVREMLIKLRDSFDIVAQQDTTGPVMGNAEVVYAGLTYGKGVLNEVITR